MKSKPMGILFGVLALVAVMTMAQPAFAANVQVTISSGASNTKGQCSDTNCFNPEKINVAVGDTVTWTNADTVGHTATSGKPSDNQTGTVFDSSLISAGKTFTSPPFTTAGDYDYFCQVHPWMTGEIIVGAGGQSSPPPSSSPPTTTGGMVMESAMSKDGSEQVAISAPAPASGQPMVISLNFTDSSGTNVKHQNYAITATQDGKTVLSNSTGHTHTGLDTQTTSALSSADPVTVQVTLNGQGLPNADPSTWTGPKGEMISFSVAPEFGQLASIILAIAVISIVALTAKTRALQRL